MAPSTETMVQRPDLTLAASFAWRYERRCRLRACIARRSPHSLGALAAAALFFACCVSFASIALRQELRLHDGQQRFLLSSHNRTPDADRTFIKELDRGLPALLLSSVAASISIAAGVGGGAFFVPLFNVLLQFSVKGATALSQASITGGAISGVACLLTRRHPTEPNRFLMDFDLALMLTPVLLLGVSMGVLANAIFPNWLITTLLTVLLLYITFLAVRKTVALHRSEQRAAIAQQRKLHSSCEGSQHPQGAADTERLLGASRSTGDQPSTGSIRESCEYVPEAADDHEPAIQTQMQQTMTTCVQQSQGQQAPEVARQLAGRCCAASGSCPEVKLKTPATVGQASKAAPLSRQDVFAGLQSRLLRASMGSQSSSGNLSAYGEGRCSMEMASPGPRRVHGDSHSGSPPQDRLMGQSEELTSEINECDESLELDAVRQRAAVHKPAATCRHNGMQSHGECLSGRGDKGACECDIESAAEDLGLATDYSDSDLQSVGLLQERILDEQGIGILNKSVSRLARKQRHQHLPGSLREAEESPRLPWLSIAELAGLWGSFLGLQLLKSRVDRCEPAYFVLFAVQALLAVSTGVVFTWQAHRAQQSQQGQGWLLRQLIRASIVALLGGMIAGLLGIGGGMIIGPLMLELGVHPLVSAATSSLMVLFSSSMGALAYAFDGALNLQFALIFGAACCGASLIGVLGVARLVQRSGKASIVVMLLACIVGTGALLTAGFGGRNAVHDLVTSHNVGFNPFC